MAVTVMVVVMVVMSVAAMVPAHVMHCRRRQMVKSVVRALRIGSSGVRCGSCGVGRTLRMLRGVHGCCGVRLRGISSLLRAFNRFSCGAAAEQQTGAEQNNNDWAL